MQRNGRAGPFRKNMGQPTRLQILTKDEFGQQCYSLSGYQCGKHCFTIIGNQRSARLDGGFAAVTREQPPAIRPGDVAVGEAVMAGEIVWRPGLVVGSKVGWRRGEIGRDVRETTGLERGIGKRSDAERDIDAAFDQVDRGVAQVQIDRKAGALRDQGGQGRGDMTDPETHRHRDADEAVRAEIGRAHV